MKKAYPVILKYLIVFGIIVLLVWLSFHKVSVKDKNDMLRAFQHAKYILLLPVFVLLLLSHYFRSLRWKQLIEPMGYNPPVFDLLCGLLVGYLANQFIPRGGEIIRCTFVARQRKIPLEKLIGTIITERAVDVICLVVLGLAVFFFQYAFLSLNVKNAVLMIGDKFNNGSRLQHWIMALSIIAALLVIVFIIKYIKKRFSVFFAKLFRGFKEGFLSIKKLQSKGRFIIYTLLMWACYIFSTWIGCFAMEETVNLNLGTGISMLFAGTLGIILTPGGIAAYPYAIQQTVVFYGINEGAGKALGWLLWGAQFIFTVFFGTLAYIAINLRKKRYEKHGVRSA